MNFNVREFVREAAKIMLAVILVAAILLKFMDIKIGVYQDQVAQRDTVYIDKYVDSVGVDLDWKAKDTIKVDQSCLLMTV